MEHRLLQCKRSLSRLFVSSMLVFICFAYTDAQNVVKGKVVDESNEALIGVNVLVKGTQNGTATDLDGMFTLSDVDPNATLVLTYIGYQATEIPVNGQSNLEVVMGGDAQLLNEVVVVGYGTQKKVTLTGSLATLAPEELKANPVGNVSQALQGRVSGVTIENSNTPGSDAKIRIRGLGTINNNNPLWVIDGVPRTGGINEIAPGDIKSITVLKDASATAIYGARGANGVILVTTIRGEKDQAPQISFNTRMGVLKNFSKYDMLDVDEFGEMLWLQYNNSGIDPSHPVYGSGASPRVPKYILPAGVDQIDPSQYDIVTFPITEANAEGTDWYDEMFNEGYVQDYSLTVTGGTENTTYGFSGSYLKEDGILIKTGFERYTLRSNVSTSITKWLEIGETLGLSYTNDYGNQEQGGSNAPFGQLLELTAIMPVYDIEGNWAPVSRLTGIEANNNPVARLHRREDNVNQDLGLTGNAYMQVKPMENLTIKSLVGVNYSNFHGRYPLEANPESYVARPSAQLTESYSRGVQWNWVNTIDYRFQLGDRNNFNVLLGTEAINSNSENISASRNQYFLETESYLVLSAGEDNIQNSGSGSEWATQSYFGKVTYDYDNKYLVDFTVRRDGSSRFGVNNRYGVFPAASVGWVISEEDFFSDNSFLDFVKLRLSWGRSGNDQIGNYNGFSTYRTSRDFSYYPIDGSNNTVVSGFESAAFGNVNAKWETTTTYNLGLDLNLGGNFDISFDLWQRNTDDMLYRQSIPAVYGQASTPSVNVGDMKNRGFDLQLGYFGTGMGGDLKYNVSASISHYKNEIVRLSSNDDEAILGSPIREQIYTRAEIGTAFPQFFGYEIEGIFQTAEEAAAHAEFGSYNSPGHFKFKDINGDGVIDADDRTYIGNPHPDLTGGLNGSVSYKRFNLQANIYGSFGNDILNLNRRSLDFNLFQRNRSKDRLYKSWGSPYLDDNSQATLPIAEVNDAISQLPSSYYIEDGSYLRLQNLQVGYTFPKEAFGNAPIEGLNAYLMMTNVFTITGYSGLDPAIQTSDSRYGVDLATWPAPRRYTFGLNLKL